MKGKKVKWLIYTVLVGLIPVLSRLMVWSVTSPGSVALISSSDFVAFGLVLHISNINEIEHFSGVDREWKTIQNGTSIAFIALYSVLFALNVIGGGLIDGAAMNMCTLILSMVSFLISYSVYDRISKAEAVVEEGRI